MNPINYKKLICIFKKLGFKVNRQKGSHIMMTKKGVKRPIVIPTYDEIRDHIIKANMRTAGIDNDTYEKLLKKCK